MHSATFPDILPLIVWANIKSGAKQSPMAKNAMTNNFIILFYLIEDWFELILNKNITDALAHLSDMSCRNSRIILFICRNS